MPACKSIKMMSTKTKILHLTYHMGIGGTEQVISQLVQNANHTEFDNSILCIEGEVGAIGMALQESGVVFHTLNRTPGFDFKLIKSIRALLANNHIDIIHCHQYTPYVYGVLAALGTHTKVIFTEHGRFHPDRYSWKRRAVNPVLGLNTAAITAISQATKDALAHYEWFNRKSIEVIYNGIKARNTADVKNTIETTNHEWNLTNQHLVFGTITRFDTIKNLPMMIRAFAKVYQTHKHTRLLLVGDGDERADIEALVHELKLNDAVIFTGFQTDTAKFMARIDVYVLSSFSEGTSMTLLEAMSLEKCCVVTRVGGNVEIIQHESNGLIVESDNTEQLADTFLRLVPDTEIRHQLGATAKSTFEAKFNQTQMIERFARIYRQAC